MAPRLPRWLRVALFGAAAVWVVRGQRGSRFLVMRRELQRVAPGSMLVADFVALEPGAGLTGMRWVADALDAVGDDIPFVALVPASGTRAATRRANGSTCAGSGSDGSSETSAGGQGVTILVRD